MRVRLLLTEKPKAGLLIKHQFNNILNLREPTELFSPDKPMRSKNF